jgi:cobalt/nickel transport system permease protein
MHLADGTLNDWVCTSTAVVAAGGMAVAASRVRLSAAARGDEGLRAGSFAVVSAAALAAQMFNYPLGTGTSAHLIGGALAALVLGPAAGVLAMAVVVIGQCLLFNDGGLTTLGANVVNLAVVAPLAAWAADAAIGRMLTGASRRMIGAAAAGFASVAAASGSCAAMLSVSGTLSWSAAMQGVVGPHLVAAVIEGAATVVVLAVAAGFEPGMLRRGLKVAGTSPSWWNGAAAGATAVVAVMAALVASGAPDLLESALVQAGAGDGARWFAAPLAEYAFPGVGGGPVAAMMAAMAGIVVLGGASWLVALAGLRRAGSERATG